MTERNNLDEISFIRPILIVLLVLYHAFCTWTGAWSPFEGFEPSVTYKWIADFAYSFMLPMFVFQSGYVWAFQREVKGRKDDFNSLTRRKFKRLIIPSIVFSITYILIFKPVSLLVGGGNCIVLTYNILCGYAHMWFLPMLFWCFIFSWLLLKVRSKFIRYSIVIIMLVVSLIPLPLGINASFSYMLYFLIGYDTLGYYDTIKKRCSKKAIISAWIVFIIVFAACNILKDYINAVPDSVSRIVRTLNYESTKFITALYSLLGMFAMYITAVCYTASHETSTKSIQLGNLCFGVYLFQQFILMGIYRYTNMPQILGLSLPWISFIFTLILSVILSYCVRLTSLGRKLI